MAERWNGTDVDGSGRGKWGFCMPRQPGEHGTARRGVARRGVAWRGVARRGVSIAAFAVVCVVAVLRQLCSHGLAEYARSRPAHKRRLRQLLQGLTLPFAHVRREPPPATAHRRQPACNPRAHTQDATTATRSKPSRCRTCRPRAPARDSTSTTPTCGHSWTARVRQAATSSIGRAGFSCVRPPSRCSELASPFPLLYIQALFYLRLPVRSDPVRGRSVPAPGPLHRPHGAGGLPAGVAVLRHRRLPHGCGQHTALQGA